MATGRPADEADGYHYGQRVPLLLELEEWVWQRRQREDREHEHHHPIQQRQRARLAGEIERDGA